MGILDESLVSTASTLIDSCSISLDPSLDNSRSDHPSAEKENNGLNVNPIHARNTKSGTSSKRFVRAISHASQIVEKRNARLISPSVTKTHRFLQSENHSVSESTTTTNNSKLDILRARTKLLRKQGSQKIAESRASLRKNRTVQVGLSPHPPCPMNQPEALLGNTPRPAKTNSASIMTGKILGASKNMDLPVLLRRSNSVIDQLTLEMETAGVIINQSNVSENSDSRMILDTSSIYDTHVFVPPSPIMQTSHDQDIEDDTSSLHNISVDDYWDQSTISASAQDASSISEQLSPTRSNLEEPPPSQSVNCSGLPPPEVVVKITTPTSARLSRSRELAESRHRRMSPPSISPIKGDCASMYNTDQKCEKLSFENDCLRRQLELLESRHRDFQQKLDKQMLSPEKVPGALRTPGSPSTATSTSSGASSPNSYYKYHKRKRRRSDRRRLALVLIFAPFLISTTLFFYRAVRNVSDARRRNRDNALRNSGLGSIPFFADTNSRGPQATLSKPALSGLASLMREGVLRQTSLGPILFRDKSNGRIQRDNTNFSGDWIGERHATFSAEGQNESFDYADSLPVMALPKYRRIEGSVGGDNPDSTQSGRKGRSVKRWFQKRLSKMKIATHNDPAGVWLKRAQQIKTRELHAEL